MSTNENPHGPSGTITGRSKLLPTPNELIAMLSKRVIGQCEAKRVLSVAVYQHFLNCAGSEISGTRVLAENHVLLIGATGTGKSLLLETLGETLKLPTFHIPCTAITPDGYKGKNLAQHLEEVSEVLVDGGKTKPGIVVWDEMDKLSLSAFGENESVEHASVFRRMTQTEFLTYLDGAKRGIDGMDSSRILNVGIGAFVGLDIIRSMSAKPPVGFHGVQPSTEPVLEPVKPEHLIRYGLIPEFVGRFSRIACLERLDHGSMRRILLEAEDNVLARRRDFFALHGIHLQFCDDAIDELVFRAISHGTGARALRYEVDKVLRPVEHSLPDMALRGVEALVISRDAVLGLAPLIERPGKRKDLSKLLQIRRHAVSCREHKTKTAESDDLGIL